MNPIAFLLRPAHLIILAAAALCAAAMLLLTSCKAVGPDYVKPDVTAITPAKWKWQTAAPKDHMPKGPWWTVYHDPQLDRLEATAVANNQQIKIAASRMEQARFLARNSFAAFLPDLSFKTDVSRTRSSGNQPTPIPIQIPVGHFNSFNPGFDFSYELDLWGRIRRSVESVKAQAESAGADYQNGILSLTGELAADYFLLRALDFELSALRHTIELREKSVTLIEQRFKAGIIPEVDLSRARTELATAKSEIADVKRQREEASSAIALLCGVPASNFSIAERTIPLSPPSIPAGLPADLLERRPDVATAERLVAARNAEIGVAVAGYFPTIKLTSQVGSLSNDASTLFSSASGMWTIGAGLVQPIGNFITTLSHDKAARAANVEAIATYRQTVLTAVKEVETSLAQVHYRAQQATAQNDALKSSTNATNLIRKLYESGSISYLELLDAERTQLLIERQSAQIAAQQLIATVHLIKALGGGWK